MGGMSRDDTLDLERRYTLDDVYGGAFPQEDGFRYEIANGYLIVSPFARRMHGVGSIRLGEILAAACPPTLFVFSLPINVDNPTATHFEPDLTVVRREFAKIEKGDLPLLVVEIRSPSTAGRDAVLKRSEYARLGVPSFWLADVEVPSVRVLELRRGVYEEVAYAEGDDAIDVERPFPVRFTPRELITI